MPICANSWLNLSGYYFQKAGKGNRPSRVKEYFMSGIPTKVKSKELVEKRREQIVLAAIKLFSQKGFHKTTLRELAEEAGISHGNIYGYVTNKEDIFFLVFDFMIRIAFDIIDQSINGVEDPVEKLRRMVRGEFNMMHQWADAVLLIYQESHILSKPLLSQLLEKEREHVGKIETALEECIKEGRIRDCNVRLVANLIRAMVETWVVKRWDLRGHVNRLEMEKAILDLLFNGLDKEKDTAINHGKPPAAPHGKTALILNSRTFLGKSTIPFLLSKGMRVVVYEKNVFGESELPDVPSEAAEKLKIYSCEDLGQLDGSLFKKILDDVGYIDFIIHDLGINYSSSVKQYEKIHAARELNANLLCAEDLSTIIEKEFSTKGSGSIIYLAPWGWDRFADPFRYETVKRGTVALTKILAKRMAAAKINVNCIIPGFIVSTKPSEIQKDMTSQLIGDIPMGELGEISDVLDALYFLLSDGSKYITGQVLNVAGGMDES